MFSAVPTEVHLEPLSCGTIEVSVHLYNPGKVVEEALFNIQHSDSFTITLRAHGRGTSILCRPEMPPTLSLGCLLTHKQFSYNMVFTNKGKKFHKIKWSRSKVMKCGRHIESDDTM